MAFALTSYRARGFMIDGSQPDRATQQVVMTVTGLTSDVALDIGTDAGTFWVAALADTTYGDLAASALANLLTVVANASALERSYIPQIIARPVNVGMVTALTSAAYGGGSATPTLVVTGLLATDTILGATQIAKNSNNLPLIASAATCAVADQYAVTYSADPGTTGTVRVTILRAAVAAVGVGYTMALSNSRPNYTFAASNGELAYTIFLDYLMLPGILPQNVCFGVSPA